MCAPLGAERSGWKVYKDAQGHETNCIFLFTTELAELTGRVDNTSVCHAPICFVSSAVGCSVTVCVSLVMDAFLSMPWFVSLTHCVIHSNCSSFWVKAQLNRKERNGGGRSREVRKRNHAWRPLRGPCLHVHDGKNAGTHEWNFSRPRIGWCASWKKPARRQMNEAQWTLEASRPLTLLSSVTLSSSPWMEMPHKSQEHWQQWAESRME